MNRRNFILGLGTAATLSGAASVTGASLQDAVAPEADFRVIASEELNVLRNDDLDQANDANYTDVGPGSFNHNDSASATSGTNLTVNGQEDGELALALATGNDPDQPENNFTSGRAPYVNDSSNVGTNADQLNSTNTSGTETISNVPGTAEAPLQIENNTGADQPVGIQYQAGGASLGQAVDDGFVSAAEVETLFQFFMYDDNDGNLKQISPDGTGSDTVYSHVDVAAGETKLVHLVLNMTDSISSSIQEAAEATGSGGFSSGAEDDVDLLDTARFGVDA